MSRERLGMNSPVGAQTLDDLGLLIEQEIRASHGVERTGKVVEVIGTLIKVSGIDVSLGELCELWSATGVLLQRAEVVGFTREAALLLPYSRLEHISRSTRVKPLGRSLTIEVSEALLGRVIDSLGEPMDGGPAINSATFQPVYAQPPEPMSRPVISKPMPTGIRVVDAALTLAEGQRVGIVAPAGVGKSTLLGMFARQASCDVNVIALIGERGREVREFIEMVLGPEGMAKSVIVCATSDRSSLERAKAAYVATAIAEYFRDRGQRVLLMMDSLTRFARACREIGLAAGEPPTRRGYPPSIFAELPRLVERAGLGAHGSITALYTVLAEDDSGSDPIAEEVRSLLDGHIVLSRELAAKNVYPAIDILQSISRVMSQVVPDEHVQAAARIRQLLAKHREIEIVVQMGEYHPGADSLADEALASYDAIRAFLSQPTTEYTSFEEMYEQLQVLGEGDL